MAVTWSDWKLEADRVFEQAVDSLRIADVWDMAPHAHEDSPNGDGVYWSPFKRRGDKRSLSISKGGTVFKEFNASLSFQGGVKQFVEACYPDMDWREVRQLVVDRAGLRLPPLPKRPNDPAENEPTARDKHAAERARQQHLKERREAQRKRHERALHAAQALPPAKRAKMQTMLDSVRSLWEEGQKYAYRKRPLWDRVCAKRGWPVAWVDGLQMLDLMAWPAPPWGLGSGGRHDLAFLVEAPSLVEDRLELSAVGYHQRYLNRDGDTLWRYVPSVPKFLNHAKNPMSREALRLALDLELGEHVAGSGRWEWFRKDNTLLPVYPVFLGYRGRPDLVVICEGQWDALSFYGALGFLTEDNPADLKVSVLGVRGSESTDELLAYYGSWLRQHHAPVLVIADNDRAGDTWVKEAWSPQAIKRVSFVSQIAKLGSHVIGIQPGARGEDFNDYFARGGCTRTGLLEWLNKRLLS